MGRPGECGNDLSITLPTYDAPGQYSKRNSYEDLDSQPPLSTIYLPPQRVNLLGQHHQLHLKRDLSQMRDEEETLRRFPRAAGFHGLKPPYADEDLTAAIMEILLKKDL